MPPLDDVVIKPTLAIRSRSNSPTTLKSERIARTDPYQVPSRTTGFAARKSVSEASSFVVPSWAASVPLQSEPLPEGRQFAAVVQAIRGLYERRHVKAGNVIDLGNVSESLRRLDPGIFKRHNVDKWSSLIPICQRYVAFHIVLPPPQRNLGQCRADGLVMPDLERPWYAHPVNPPDVNHQVAELCRQANLPLSAFLSRISAAPLQRTPEPESLPEPAQLDHDPVPLQAEPTLWSPLWSPLMA